MKKILLAAALGLFSLVTAHAGPINEKCPVSGKDVADGKQVDVKVAFCCDDCKEKFDKAPAEYLKMVAAAEEGKCPFSGKPTKANKSSTVTVGVCCANCEKKVKAAPKPFLEKLGPKGL